MKNKHYQHRFRELGNTPGYAEPLIDASYDLINAAEFVSQPGMAETWQVSERQLPKFRGGEITTAQWNDDEFSLATNFVQKALIMAVRERGKGETVVIEQGNASFYNEKGLYPGARESLTKERTGETMKHLSKALGHFGIYDLLDMAQLYELAA